MQSKHRHFKHAKKYEGTLEALGTGIAFFVVGVVSLVLRQVEVDFIGLSYWGTFMFIPAFFVLLGATSQVYNDRQLRKEVLAFLRTVGPGNYALESIALEVGVKPNDLLRILVDLRTAGKVAFRYDGETGQVVLGQALPPSPAPAPQAPVHLGPVPERAAAGESGARERNFCVYCGYPVKPNQNFCESCGSRL
ncbi:MAG: hypothetical protein Kow0069_30660 [Promethearchaeota archaeon]